MESDRLIDHRRRNNFSWNPSKSKVHIHDAICISGSWIDDVIHILFSDYHISASETEMNEIPIDELMW
jgi:hypothetical protein